MLVTRRHAFGLGAAALSTPALAQRSFPDKPIRMLVPWAPGGTTDVQMRAVCEQAGKRLGQPVIVENKPGAGGILGAQALLNERPDGYTLAQMPISVFRVPFMSQRPPFDPLNDFTYVSHLTGYLFGVVVKADAPWPDFKSFLADAKANPGKFNYGTPGVGTSLHITMEQIATQQDVQWVHVPFRGVAENMQALLGGQIHATADSSGWGPLVEEGRLRLLVSWGPERAKRFPQVPTLKELGIDIVSTSPYGVAGPKAMDREVVRVLDAAFKEAVADPVHVAILDKFDMPAMHMGPDAYTAFVRKTVEEESAMIRRMGLKL
ncbi:Bug family tripartite tricarboxylate transporter substrate binding protein [Roseomonas xinghualingensis]|uniref:Bug family tripartite tricarboxylate transporter substrate binding protein n=1 Tax=Roseomonas xinghualingensis TaxID=2986475 RepID=UPI0021F14D8F|nr:tripartite tricarboxylate transporter substrate binding protein [Roseomonas sp. SXEYE001]MCV4208480.1 tripartite tricarboxylate transporter substrate binding protein [Roseomonas sp. SXEYE001]